MIVQIYEIQKPEEAEKCIELGVDHIGSVLLSSTAWRVPSIKEVMSLSCGTDKKNTLIPLFQDKDTLYRSIDYYRPQYIHLCENLADPAGNKIDLGRFVLFQTELKEKFPEVGIIRSIPIPRENAEVSFSPLLIAHAFEPVTDIFLTDTWLGNEPVKGYIGITGRIIDLEIAREVVLQSSIPFIMAGGLSPENVFDALIKVPAQGADSCTLTNCLNRRGETIRFQKDFQRVKKFTEEVRRYEEFSGLTQK